MDEGVKDILIVGAGPVGAVCALALQQRGVSARVLEAQPADARVDTRTLALSHGARLILERLGVWALLDSATPITRIHISQRGALGVARLAAEEVGVPALGYVLPYARLTEALKHALQQAGIAVEYGVAVDRIEPGSASAVLHTADGRTLAAPLVVVADGGRGEDAPAPKFERQYDQAAVVCEVKTELPHANRAFERFTPEGPAALLPKGNGYALVWTARREDAERIAQLPDTEFLAALYRHFGGRQGFGQPLGYRHHIAGAKHHHHRFTRCLVNAGRRGVTFGNHNAVFGFARITHHRITAFDLAAGQEAFAALLVDGL